ncbi:MAG: hypothetical protein GX568_06490 [Candidatus Gastranaerophilales bacterium]|nr:hypothetical protein [Candidatus Gastranaerophilales bacterium]
MKIKLLKLFLFLLIISLNLPAFCTELPEAVVNYIKKEVPGTKIRFDGLIELPGSTNYLPVLPLILNKNVETLETVQTIPAGKKFSQKPDMILFNNNLALLRIIQKPGAAPTVIDSPEMPLKVKLGLLPQDLIVPRGLKLPSDLKVILGDLKIPLIEKAAIQKEIPFQARAEVDKVVEQATTETAAPPLPELDFLNDKKLYVLNHRTSGLELLNSRTGRAETVINLPSSSFNMALDPDRRYILLSAPALNKVFVVDSVDNQLIKTLDVGKLPSNIYCSPKSRKAYIANGHSSSISEVDLKKMQVEREIPCVGYPDNIQTGNNPDLLFYNDRMSGKVYQLNLKTGNSTELTQIDSVSKMALIEDSLFILSRNENALIIFDLKALEAQNAPKKDKSTKSQESQDETKEVIRRIITSEKPLDFLVLPDSGKILVVCAGADAINVIDMAGFEVVNTVQIDSGSFPGGITAIKDNDIALINTYDGYEIIIYNIKDDTIKGQIPVSQTVSKIIISDR